MFQNMRPSLSSDYESSDERTYIIHTYIYNIHIHIMHKQYDKQHTYVDVYSTEKCFKMRVRVFRPLHTLQYITLYYNT